MTTLDDGGIVVKCGEAWVVRRDDQNFQIPSPNADHWGPTVSVSQRL